MECPCLVGRYMNRGLDKSHTNISLARKFNVERYLLLDFIIISILFGFRLCDVIHALVLAHADVRIEISKGENKFLIV